MLKQWPNRNQRTKGFMMKQGIQIFALIAVIIWLLFQLNHSHDKRKPPHEESSAQVYEKLKDIYETKKLGRKGFHPWINKPYGLMDETELAERVVEHSSGGDDDIVGGHDTDRVDEVEEEPEEVEDLIDEEDKEKEEEEIEEDMSLLEDHGHHEGEPLKEANLL